MCCRCFARGNQYGMFFFAASQVVTSMSGRWHSKSNDWMHNWYQQIDISTSQHHVLWLSTWCTEEAKEFSHPMTRQLGSKTPGNCSRDFWSFCRIPVVAWRMSRRICFHAQAKSFRKPTLGAKSILRYWLNFLCILLGFLELLFDQGNNNDPCSYGKWQAGSSLWDERAQDVRAFLGCQVHVLRSWSGSQLWWHWKILVPPLGSQITLGNGHHSDKSTHPTGFTRGWGKTTTSVLSKARKDDWYLVKCSLVAPKKR